MGYAYNAIQDSEVIVLVEKKVVVWNTVFVQILSMTTYTLMWNKNLIVHDVERS